MSDLSMIVAKIRNWYNINTIDVVNALNQMHILSDERAEELNRKKMMTLIEDIWPRIFGKDKIDSLFENEES